MPRIAVDFTGRSVAGALELLKTTTIAHKIADQPTTLVWNVASLRCLNCDGELQACLQGCAGDTLRRGVGLKMRPTTTPAAAPETRRELMYSITSSASTIRNAGIRRSDI
jgi:hypothetical protein